MDTLVKITLQVPGADALREVTSLARLSPECGAPKRNSDGSYLVVAYGTAAEAAKLAGSPYLVELDEHFGEQLAERQKEVSRKDRFKAGKRKPEGLGEKR
jgi:hypothetical protein